MKIAEAFGEQCPDRRVDADPCAHVRLDTDDWRVRAVAAVS
jgi:hypothetical protein